MVGRVTAVFLLWLCGTPIPDAWGYIDPGTGQQVWSTLGPALAVLVTLASFVLLPFRWMWAKGVTVWKALSLRLRIAICVLAATGLLLGGVTVGVMVSGKGRSAPTAMGKAAPMKAKRVLVIGIDGLDPELLGRMMAGGELPHFSSLKARGTFAPLQTTIPPESPVAWVAAATGCNPGRTGVFDFIHRDPKTCLPDLAIPRTIGGRSGKFVPATDERTVWDTLSERGIPVQVLRWPVTFPPTPVNGRMLSGLGTPDVCGTMGRYRFFSTRPVAVDDKMPERVIVVRWEGGRIATQLPGPDVHTLTGTKTSMLQLIVERDDAGGVSVTLGKNPPVRLRVGAWSPWQSISFPGGLSKACPAMVRLYLTSLEPDFALYVSPPHIDPSSPAFGITAPKEFSKELAARIGPYATLGMPEDGQAVTHGRIPPSAFIDLCNLITDEREKMFDEALKEFREGALFAVFDTNDRVQHMFWAATDRTHPAHTAEIEREYGRVIGDHYRRMDGVIGKALAVAQDGQTALFVISDHGFTSFSRAVHLNTWLVGNGYMALKEGEKAGEALLESVDWSRTRAYAVGFCSLYVNVKGREGNGIVEPGDRRKVSEEIAGRLKLWIDPQTKGPVVRNAYLRDEVYHGSRVEDAPDVIVGYYPGYRASWRTALGAAPAGEAVVANDEAWAGDHLVDAPCVPGVLLSNLGLRADRARLIDIPATVLAAMGISGVDTGEGVPLF